MRIRIQVFGELIEYLKSSTGGKMVLEVPEKASVETKKFMS
jgi:hypothetical protein